MSDPGGTLPPTPANQVFPPEDRPEIQLLRDGRWVDADLHAWQARGNEQWASVVWSEGGQTWRDTVPADRLRPNELSDELRGVLAFSQRTFPDDATRDAAIYAELQIDPVRYQHQLAWLAQQGHFDAPERAIVGSEAHLDGKPPAGC